MKKFITALPLQTQGELKKTLYTCGNNQRMNYDIPCSFPILPVIHAFTRQDEEIAVVAIHTQAEPVEANKSVFLSQLGEAQKSGGFRYSLLPLYIPHSEDKDKHLALFRGLLDLIEKEDELYACLTFGDKPTALVTFLAMNYAYKLRHASVEALVYGMIPKHGENHGILYDVTSLFYLNAIVEKAGLFDDVDAEQVVQLLLGMD